MRKYRTFFLFLIILSHISFSQQKTNTDTLKTDTLKKAGKAEKIKDSVETFIPIRNLDMLSSQYDSTQFILKNEIQYSDYFNFSDIASYFKGFIVFDFGNPGQPNPLLFEGLDYRNINIFIDGIPIQNSFFGIPEQTLIMPEDISKIEIIPTSESFLYGKGGAAKSINIITTKFNTSTPFTNLRHIEAPYETYLTDGIFSQNITRNSNIMIGFNYQTSTGRYSNSDYTFFNVRSRYRLNISNDLNILISDYFYKNERGLNGGLIPYDTNIAPVDIYDERAAIPQYPDAKEKISRNDLNLIIGAKLLNDSINSSRLSISFATESRKFDNIFISRDRRVTKNYYRDISNYSLNIEAKQNYKYEFNNFSTSLGLNYLKINSGSIGPQEEVQGSIDKSYWSILYCSLYDNIIISNLISANLFTRYNIFSSNLEFKYENNFSMKNNKNNLSFGFDCRYDLYDFIQYIEFANYFRLPSLAEISWGIYDDLMSEKSTYFAAGFKYLKKNFSIDLNLFLRKIKYPDYLLEGSCTGLILSSYPKEYSYRDEQNYKGVNLKVSGNLWKFEYEINANFVNGKLNDLKLLMVPEFISSFGLYFQDTIATKNIGIKIGINGKFFSKFDGFFFYPDNYGLMPFGRDYSKPYVPSNGSLNLLGIVKIQDAIIYLTLENILDKKYYIVPYYPINDRSFKLAVSWSFND